VILPEPLKFGWADGKCSITFGGPGSTILHAMTVYGRDLDDYGYDLPDLRLRVSLQVPLKHYMRGRFLNDIFEDLYTRDKVQLPGMLVPELVAIVSQYAFAVCEFNLSVVS
jgi:hypothetical protein